MSGVKEASVYVTAVRIEYAGAQLAGDHASGVSELVVDDAFEFNEGGGELLIDGDTLTYTGWDDETNTIALSAPTLSAYDADEKITLLPSTPIKVADVVDISGASIPAVVFHSLDPFLREGIYGPDEQPTGTIFYTADYDKVWLVNIPGKVAELDPATIEYPTTTNRCTDPEPASRDNWVGGDVADGGGVWAFGYGVTNDSTYEDQGLHVKIAHGSGGGEGKISPNGDGFGVDPFNPGGFGNALGTDVKTYKITEDMVFAFSLYSTFSCQIEMNLYLYEADGTEISHTVSSSTYMTNQLVTVPANTHSRYSTHVYYDALLDDFPTLDSVAFMPFVGGGDAGAETWVGSCMAVDAGGLSPDATVPYQASGGVVVYPNPPTTWAEIPDKPSEFPPSAHTHAAADITDLDSGVADLINDDTTPSDVRTALDALYSGGGGGLDDPGVAALIADDTTPSDTRTALEALTLNDFTAPASDLSIGTHKLTDVVDPSSPQDAATKKYVDDTITGGPGGATDTATAALVADRTSDTGEALDLLYADRMGNAVQRSTTAIVPIPGATAPSFIGIPAVTATGSGFAVSPTSGSKHSSSKRNAYIRVSAATTNAAGWSGSIAYLWRGNAAGLGGFKADFRFGPHSGQAVAGRMFTGLTVSTAAPTDVEPSTLVSMIGVGFDAADTQLYVMHNDASGTATKVATGLTRSSVDASQVYTLHIECAPNGSSMTVAVVDEVAGTSFTTSPSTDLPANTSFMVPRSWTSVGGVNSVTGMALMGYYSESDY